VSAAARGGRDQGEEYKGGRAGHAVLQLCCAAQKHECTLNAPCRPPPLSQDHGCGAPHLLLPRPRALLQRRRVRGGGGIREGAPGLPLPPASRPLLPGVGAPRRSAAPPRPAPPRPAPPRPPPRPLPPCTPLSPPPATLPTRSPPSSSPAPPSPLWSSPARAAPRPPSTSTSTAAAAPPTSSQTSPAEKSQRWRGTRGRRDCGWGPPRAATRWGTAARTAAAARARAPTRTTQRWGGWA
jgi:hypothetical protein